MKFVTLKKHFVTVSSKIDSVNSILNQNKYQETSNNQFSAQFYGTFCGEQRRIKLPESLVRMIFEYKLENN